jgi:glycosyltransferase involved in cell wall biosynthesis
MKLVLFCHPAFSGSQSMPRFAGMLESAYRARGHEVETWSPRAQVFKWFSRLSLGKWGGYIDQYVLFPAWVRKSLKSASPDTLFVFCDQALGPWVPLVRERPHVVHAHDLLALRSALGDIPENPTSLTGRIYQRYIRRGFRQARHFISVSKKTRDDLHRFGQVSPQTSDYVYNGLSFPYAPLRREEAKNVLTEAGLAPPEEGMLLNLGGSQWYKNRPGLLAIYARYVEQADTPLPLWIIGPKPNAAVEAALRKVPSQGRVLFVSGLANRTLQAAYSYARVFLFPSLAEGFGWPIIEALACGCPVITTDEAPMNEIGGIHAHYIKRLKYGEDTDAWAVEGAELVRRLLQAPIMDFEKVSATARQIVAGFDAATAIDAYLKVYEGVLARRRVDMPALTKPEARIDG